MECIKYGTTCFPDYDGECVFCPKKETLTAAMVNTHRDKVLNAIQGDLLIINHIEYELPTWSQRN